MSPSNREQTRPHPPLEEPQQADPWLKEGQLSPWAIWPVAAAVLVLLLMVVYAIAS
jgi:hypothetical protein